MRLSQNTNSSVANNLSSFFRRPPTEAADALREYLAATDECDAQCWLDKLLGPATVRQIDQTTRRFLRAETGESEDLRQEVLRCLLEKLQQLRRTGGFYAIKSWPPYVAQVTHNCCYAHLQRHHPHWRSLREQLRYRLHASAVFDWWRSDNGRETFCGLAIWRNLAPTAEQQANWQRWAETSANRVPQTSAKVSGAFLEQLFKAVGGPVALPELVGFLVARAGQSAGAVFVEGLDDDLAELANVPDRNDLMSEIEQRNYLQHIWQEIQELPPNQKTVLLLTFKEGLDLFPLLGVASLRDLAAALKLSAERLAELWPQLPLTDAATSQLLGLTDRQQIINLRQAARNRLRRRFKPSNCPR